MKIQYISKRWKDSQLERIAQANKIITEFQKQGFDLTLRQLFYQFVARGLLANKQTEYKNLGNLINDGRLAGLVSWGAIVDRTRNLQSNSHWETPADIVRACAKQFRIDLWERQPIRVEVWIEKDALVGVIEGVCRSHDVSYFSCRGYASQSEVWAAGQRFLGYAESGQDIVVIHLGDHDPSGIDMTRDIEDRIRLFMGEEADKFSINRIALNMDQVKKFNPPPNPAKFTDTRADRYVRKFGNSSWELDALDPKTLYGLIEKAILENRDDDLYDEATALQEEHRETLQETATELEDKE